jgi:hypothetical protein
MELLPLTSMSQHAERVTSFQSGQRHITDLVSNHTCLPGAVLPSLFHIKYRHQTTRNNGSARVGISA